MIKTECYGGGTRWHCTNCDADKTVPGSNIPHIYWTAGVAPAVCPRCNPHKEYHVKLDFNILLPEKNAVDVFRAASELKLPAEVRAAIDKAKGDLAGALRICLDGRDVKLNKWSVGPGGYHEQS